MTIELSVSDTVPDASRDLIRDGVMTHNGTLLGPSDKRDLFIPLTDDQGNIDGGLVGYTGRGWLYVELLFVPERLRGQGMAARLLEAAEAEAKTRGCIGAYLDTINPVARRTYERAGYSVFGQIDNFTKGFDINWMIKRF
ncbi:GNAT family N-acetyltransferase [Peteryoungia desertarenae]|uniref:GNAT family N-acetyltransferase n=1 Tax=Peteryoungia desertarenae TaxID=1813451 RepID=A0ABX6QR70_9HYPH|nr:GNAT family N-acetyltransferase [Peteryoungia desertarenae]QLF71009.1 GNAT family N-acetyltransferase [Peteryoungia desertarenae]